MAAKRKLWRGVRVTDTGGYRADHVMRGKGSARRGVPRRRKSASSPC